MISPGRLIAVTVVVGAVGIYQPWRFLVNPKLGVIDLSIFHGPIVAAAGVGLGHLGWHRLGRTRTWLGGALACVVALAVGAAVFALQTRPSLTLSIWGERPLAGLVIDQLFDLDAIRAGLSPAEFQPRPRAGAAHPDIIIVTIDTVRADHTPPYGGGADMPILRELGMRGAVFDWAFSPSNVTRRSLPAMMIGLAPNRIRGGVVGWALRLDPR